VHVFWWWKTKASINSFLAELLEQVGITVELADNGQEAVDLVAASAPF